MCKWVLLLVVLSFVSNTTKNTKISPNFLTWTFCGKAQFPQSFGQIAQNYAETVPFYKISTPENKVKLWYFSQSNQFKKEKVNINCLQSLKKSTSKIHKPKHL